jgi:hypothetical protein
MSTAELRAHIVHRLADISDTIFLEKINTMLDFKVSEPIFRCTEEQHKAIAQAQQAVARGESVSNEEMKKAVELCLNGN